LRDHPLPGRHAAVDEIDEAFVYANTTYILSEGAQGTAPATNATARPRPEAVKLRGPAGAMRSGRTRSPQR
jgi:hypothetical protein